ncbi:unnamed protein product [Calicophoron daubneyi]|uniref:Ion transport domain-containing protein n=1 Tax=Calicophoron daubneyi TaxID=300641 RepID=A0AAV2T824_CALDB
MLLRIHRKTFIAAKTLYAMTLIACYMRLYRLYTVHPRLGPKLMMIKLMVYELTLFLFILVVVLVAYGVAVQSLLFPNREMFDLTALRDVFYYPYWNLYGELSLEYSFATESSCTGPADGVKCPYFNIFVPLLLATYLLIAAILMINLLIAIFSNVFQKVEDRSIEIWKFSMYYLVLEYHEKPCMPTPFNTIEGIVKMVYHAWKRLAKRRARSRARLMAALGPHSNAINSLLKQTLKSYQRNTSESQSGDEDGEEVVGDQMFDFALVDDDASDKDTTYSSDMDTVTDLATPAISDVLTSLKKLESALDEEERTAGSFVNSCKKRYLKKVKNSEERSVEAVVCGIKSKLDELADDVSSLNGAVQHVAVQGTSRKN